MTIARHRRTLLAASAFLIAMGTTSGVLALAAPDHDEHSQASAAPTTKSNKPDRAVSSSKPEKPAIQPSKVTGEHDQPAIVSMPGKGRGKSASVSKTDHDSLADESSRENAHADVKGTDAHGASEPKAKDILPEGKAEPAKSGEDASEITAQQALKLLKDGNARWVAGSPTAPNSDASRRRETASDGQNPFVTVITCADSRCPVERLFDRGVGDVFVARVAGNVIGDHAAGTVEYGAEHLHIPLIVVMGHTSCGAVKAATAGAKPGHNINSLIHEIEPAVARAKAANPDATDEQLLIATIRENVYQSMFDLLKTSPMTAKFVQDGKVEVVGAVYDISTGKVEFLGTHPWQTQLLEAMLPGAPASGSATADATSENSH